MGGASLREIIYINGKKIYDTPINGIVDLSVQIPPQELDLAYDNIYRIEIFLEPIVDDNYPDDDHDLTVNVTYIGEGR